MELIRSAGTDVELIVSKMVIEKEMLDRFATSPFEQQKKHEQVAKVQSNGSADISIMEHKSLMAGNAADQLNDTNQVSPEPDFVSSSGFSDVEDGMGSTLKPAGNWGTMEEAMMQEQMRNNESDISNEPAGFIEPLNFNSDINDAIKPSFLWRL